MLGGDCPWDQDAECVPSLYPPVTSKVRDLERFLFFAKHSDVVLTPKKQSSSSCEIHLTSKDAPVYEESLAFTTTRAFLHMFEACWLEFKLKDGCTGTLQTKLIILFKGSGVSVPLKPYEAGDDFPAFDPQETRPASYAWLPSPPKKVEIGRAHV